MINVLMNDLKQAMKDKDSIKKGTLQLLINSIKNSEKEQKKTLTETEELALVQKELKQSREMLENAEKAQRSDLIEEAQKRISILLVYLPEQYDKSKIVDVVNEVIKELNISAPTIKDKGLIMKNLMPKLKGKADGGLINQVVSEILK